MSRLALLLVALLFSLQAHAAPASPESIDTLFTMMHVDRTLGAASVAAEAQMRQGMAAARQGKTPTPEQQAIEERAIQRGLVVIHDELNWDKLKPQFTRIYVETYSQEEVDGLIAFFRSPAGQAYLAKTPQLMQQVMQFMQSYMAEIMPKMQQIARDAARESAAAAAAASAPN
jgi:hypothetical protein